MLDIDRNETGSNRTILSRHGLNALVLLLHEHCKTVSDDVAEYEAGWSDYRILTALRKTQADANLSHVTNHRRKVYGQIIRTAKDASMSKKPRKTTLYRCGRVLHELLGRLGHTDLQKRLSFKAIPVDKSSETIDDLFDDLLNDDEQ